jgi:4-hydroxy-tetrahydrodipicolinate synthase
LNEALPENQKLYLYNIPQLTGVPISSHLLNGLLEEYPNRIGGVKDSQGNFANTIELCQQFPQLDIFVGTDKFLLDGLQIGSAGCVTAGANLLAPLDVAVYQSFIQGKLLIAEEIQHKLTAARAALEKYPPFPPTLKSLLRFRYNTEGWEVRPPLSALSNDHLQTLLGELKQLGIEGYLPWLMK